MSSITITIKIDVPEGSSVNVGHESGEPATQPVQAEVAETVEAPKPKKQKKSTTRSAPVAAVEAALPTAVQTEPPARDVEQPESSESTKEPSESGSDDSSEPATTPTSPAEGDVKELLATVLTMLKSGRIHEDKAVAKEMIKEVSRTFGVDTVPQVPREKWGEYMIALDAKISERSVA
jgi:hypothetical protein